ncbi:hypothetical protein ACFOGI_15355 [Virgibacillus xinjiangensis]|uniref:Uncharacterized protein n=1 Tax=Virgibacillus xinjiangensis TaxID=393090 RepID=A0ABV7CZE9_9BACI
MSEKNRLIDMNELERFLWYLQSKSDSAFERETEKAVKRFLTEIRRDGG